MPNLNNREDWLNEAVLLIRPMFEGLDEKLPEKIRVSVGWSKGAKGSQVGWCWPSAVSEDGSTQIFVGPERGPDETLAILGIVVHEMNHASDDCSSGHQGHFATLNRKLGFLGKPTSSSEKSPELVARLQRIADLLGPYPHAALTPGMKLPTQKTYMLKIGCPDCQIVARATRSNVDKGLPVCACGEEWIEYQA